MSLPISRKRFLEQLGLAGAGALTTATGLFNGFFGDHSAIKPISNIGIQLYSIIPLLREDFEGTLQTLANIGYKEIEFAGPYFFTPGEDGEQSGFYGNNAQQMRALLDQAGLQAPAAHIGIQTFRNNLPQVIEAAHTIGMQYLICPFLTADQRQSLDDYKRLSEEFNQFGEHCKDAGLQFAYHNHSFEFGMLDGQIPYNVLLESTEPDLVAMELDLFWITIAGFDPVDYFNGYPGRFHTVHVKDMKKKMVLENPLTTFEDQATAQKAFGNLEDVGNGVIDFKRILSEHEKAGIRHYFVERDRAPQPMQTVKNAYANLAKVDIG